MKKLIARFFRDEGGQALTEYVLLVSAVIVGVAWLWEGLTIPGLNIDIPGMREALLAYYKRIVTIVSLPIP